MLIFLALSGATEAAQLKLSVTERNISSSKANSRAAPAIY